MAQAAMRTGKRTADAGSGVHRAIRRRSTVNNSNGASNGAAIAGLAPVGAAAGAKPSTSQPAPAAAPQVAAPTPAPQQQWSGAPTLQPAGASVHPPFMPPFSSAWGAPSAPAAASDPAAAALAPGCAIGTPAPSGDVSNVPAVSGAAAPGSSATTPVLGVPTFPAMALAAAKQASCFSPFGMMMGPPPFFMLMMQRQMAMMQQMGGNAGANPAMMAMMAMGGFAGGGMAPHAAMQQQQQQQQQQMMMMSSMFGGNPALMQATGGGMPCYPTMPGAAPSAAGAWPNMAAPGGFPFQPQQPAASKPFGEAMPAGMLPQQQQPQAPLSLDMAAVVSALAAQQQQQQQQGDDSSATTTTHTTTRSSAGGNHHYHLHPPSKAAMEQHALARSDTLGSQHRPTSSADTLTGGDAATAMLHGSQVDLFGHGGGAEVGGGGAVDEAQLSDLEFNSFIDCFLSTSALAGSSGALDAAAVAAEGAAGGVGGILAGLDHASTVGDPALDLHLPLAELLPELGLGEAPHLGSPTLPQPQQQATTHQQQQQQQPSKGGMLPLGLALEPQSVLEGLGSLVAGAVGSSGSSDTAEGDAANMADLALA